MAARSARSGRPSSVSTRRRSSWSSAISPRWRSICPSALALFLIGLPFVGRPPTSRRRHAVAAGRRSPGCCRFCRHRATSRWPAWRTSRPARTSRACASFATACAAHWRLALRCSLVSLVVLVALRGQRVLLRRSSAAAGCASSASSGCTATLFWLSLHLYLVPLLVHVARAARCSTCIVARRSSRSAIPATRSCCWWCC